MNTNESNSPNTNDNMDPMQYKAPQNSKINSHKDNSDLINKGNSTKFEGIIIVDTEIEKEKAPQVNKQEAIKEKLMKIKEMKQKGKNKLTHSVSSPKMGNFSRFSKNSSLIKSFGGNQSQENKYII